MKNLICLFLVFFIFNNKSFTQQTGKIDYEQLGVSFTIPDGWTGQESEGIFLMGHNSIPGYIFIIPHEVKMTIEQMMAESKSGLEFGAGSYLKSAGTITQIGKNQIGGEFEGMAEFTPARAYTVGIANPYGNGLTIIALTSTEKYQPHTYKALADKVRNSVIFTKPIIPAVPAKGTKADWKYELGGTKLTYMETYSSGATGAGGYSMKTEIHLCQAGYFHYYDSNSVSVDTGVSHAYTGGTNSGDGTWAIVIDYDVPYLVLSFLNGHKAEYQLEWREKSKLFLSGTRYFRTWEGSQAPDCND